VKCVECHTSISRGHSLAEVKETCVQCHETRYGEMTDEWQKEVSGQMKSLKHSLEARRVQKQKMEAPAGKVEEALRAIDEDKSKGVHNFIYAKKLMSEAEKGVLVTQKPFSKGLE